MENAPSPLAPGRPFGGAFTLLRPLGAGGAASVWLAREDALGREVALKIPARDDPAARGRFLDEARALAAVRHPGVVAVLRWGEDPATGLPFFAMPVHPATLANLFARQPRLPEAAAAELGLALVPALAALHAAGLAHRDLKPSNVLLDASGAPVLADPCGPRGGTPAWAAPEQLAGKNDNSALVPVGGAAADWHALGLLLYRALAGALPPPRGILPVAVEPPRGSLPRDLRPRPSRGWEPLLCALLDPDPETRLADPDAILRILSRLRRRALLRARLHRLRRPALGVLAALAVAALLAAILRAGSGDEGRLETPTVPHAADSAPGGTDRSAETTAAQTTELDRILEEHANRNRSPEALELERQYEEELRRTQEWMEDMRRRAGGGDPSERESPDDEETRMEPSVEALMRADRERRARDLAGPPHRIPERTPEEIEETARRQRQLLEETLRLGRGLRDAAP